MNIIKNILKGAGKIFDISGIIAKNNIRGIIEDSIENGFKKDTDNIKSDFKKLYHTNE